MIRTTHLQITGVRLNHNEYELVRKRGRSHWSDYLFKIVLIGDSGVGKSSLLLRFAVGDMVPFHHRTEPSPTASSAQLVSIL